MSELHDEEADTADVDNRILADIAMGLIGIPSAQELIESLGCRDEQEFCERRGCQSLIDYFFGDNFFVRMHQVSRELAAGR